MKQFKKIFKYLVSVVLFVSVSFTTNIGLCGPIPFWYSHNGFVMKYNKVMDNMQCSVELGGQPLVPTDYKIKHIDVRDNVYYNIIAQGADGPSIYIINDIKNDMNYLPKVNASTIVVDLNSVQYPVVIALMETVAIISTANDTSDHNLNAEARNGVQSVLWNERKSFDFHQGFRNFHVENVSVDGKIKIRVNFYV